MFSPAKSRSRLNPDAATEPSTTNMPSSVPLVPDENVPLAANIP